MQIMIWVTKAELKDNYKIAIDFNDGWKGTIDFKPILERDNREIMKELLDRRNFEKMTVAMDTVCWENGVDFAPEFLYANAQVTYKENSSIK
jgi:hypothetical protein